MRKKRNDPVMMITLLGSRGVVVGDSRPRDVPLATNKQYDVTLSNVRWDGGMDELAATRRPLGLLSRLLSVLRT